MHWRLCTIYEYTHMYFPYSSVPVPEEGCNDGGDWAVRVEVWGWWELELVPSSGEEDWLAVRGMDCYWLDPVERECKNGKTVFGVASLAVFLFFFSFVSMNRSGMFLLSLWRGAVWARRGEGLCDVDHGARLAASKSYGMEACSLVHLRYGGIQSNN